MDWFITLSMKVSSIICDKMPFKFNCLSDNVRNCSLVVIIERIVVYIIVKQCEFRSR
jgi:hypothetical protein